MAIALVQSNTGSQNITGGTSMSSTWTSATAAGNFLLACLSFTSEPGAITPPAGGWVLVDTKTQVNVVTKQYKLPNAAAQSGAKTWSWVTGVDVACVILAEYSSVDKSSPQDVEAINGGSSTTPTTATITTTVANELLAASIGQIHSGVVPTFSAPTNSFTIEAQVGSTNADSLLTLKLGLVDRIVSSTGSYSTAVTSSANNNWADVLAGFKQASANKLLPLQGVG